MRSMNSNEKKIGKGRKKIVATTWGHVNSNP